MKLKITAEVEVTMPNDASRAEAWFEVRCKLREMARMLETSNATSVSTGVDAGWHGDMERKFTIEDDIAAAAQASNV